MSRLGTLLRTIRRQRGLPLPAMADALRTAPAHLAAVECGLVFPPAILRRRWADALGFADLLDFDDQWRGGWPALTRARRGDLIPVINAAPAGPAIDYEEFGIDSGVGYDYVPRANTPEQQTAPILFAAVLVGDSMTPHYHEGDLVIFRPVAPGELLPPGSPVFVRFTATRDHTCTFKRLGSRTTNTLELRPDNPAYPPLLVPLEEIDRIALALERRPGFAKQPLSPAASRRDATVQEFFEE